ncbi:MAG: hypothetical protein WAT39_20415 [Planctomycetota bacterium]
MNSTLRSLALLALPALAACGGIPTKAFVIDCIDTGGNPRPCLIVVNQDFGAAVEKNQYVNVAADDELAITIPFDSAEVEITAVPVLVEGNQVTRHPKSRTEALTFSGFVDEVRRLRLSDHRRHLFILARRSGG